MKTRRGRETSPRRKPGSRNQECRIAAFVCLFLLLLIPSPALSKLYVDLENPLAKMPVAVPDFVSGQPGNLKGSDLARVIHNDLFLTGLFRIVEGNTVQPQDPMGDPNFGAWAGSGAQALITAGFVTAGDQFTLEAKLYEVATRKLLVGKRFIGRTSDHRHMVHRFCDYVMQELTGVPGCFATRIAFVGAGQSRELFSMDFDGHGLRQLTGSRSIILSPDWGPGGRNLVFTGYMRGNPDLWSLDLVTGEQHLISGRAGLNASARYSPRKDVIALSMDSKGIPKIFIISPQGNIINMLTNGRGNDISPTWSPDGSTIAYVSDHAGTPQIYTIPANGGTPKRLTFGSNYNTDPDWSPRGDVLAFTARIDGRFQVCTIKADGTGHRVLTNQGANEDPAWSPDGRLIAFSSSRRGQKEIYVMDARGEIQIRVSPIPGKSSAWSPANTR